MSLVQPRQKHALWEAFGQVLIGEGVYSGTVGTGELESSSVQADGTLGAFGLVPGAQSPAANVYNAAAVTSPILSSGGEPRFLLLGGQALQAPLSGGGGALSANVWHNSAP